MINTKLSREFVIDMRVNDTEVFTNFASISCAFDVLLGLFEDHI
jgi:hypothetical protein